MNRTDAAGEPKGGLNPVRHRAVRLRSNQRGRGEDERRPRRLSQRIDSQLKTRALCGIQPF